MSDKSAKCTRCGSPVGRNVADGVCASCVLGDALPDAEAFSGGEGEPAAVLSFGSFDLIEEIGRGGMGVIYRARQHGLDRAVALKMLLAGEFADDKARELLLREARIAARLSHPNIVTIHEVGEHAGRPYFAMEYVPGRNLAQLCRDGLLPVSAAVRYMEQLSRAVHYAHQHGVIHRDLKPANVLIGPDDQPKLTDFGLTKSLVEPTRTIESAGSPNFMAPEQADSKLGSTGTPTDVFGLGAILYYLLTGRPPAVGESLTETLRAVVACEPAPPRQLRPALAKDLETITLKCLEKDASRRYDSALEVAEELARWQRNEPILARPSSRVERLAKWVRRHPLIATLSAAVAVSLFGGLVATTWQARKARQATSAARTAELAARRNAYVAEITLANAAADKESWQEVRHLLDRVRPDAGQLDLRGWEWRYLWQASRSEAERAFLGATNHIGSIAALEDGNTVALGETEGGFSLWDLRECRQLYRLPDPINRVRHPTAWGGAPVICRVAAVPGAGLLAYTDCQSPTNGFVRLWDIARRQTKLSIPLPGIPRHLAVSRDGRSVACSLMWPDTRTFVFDASDGHTIALIESPLSGYSPCNTLAFSADGLALSVEDVKDRCIRVVELATGRDLHRFPLGQDFPLTAAFSPDGRWLVTGGGFEPAPRVLVWDLHSGERLMELPASSQFSIHFDKTGRRLITGLSIWRVPEFTLEREFTGENPSAKTAVLMADGDTLLTEDGGSVRRWRIGAPSPHRGGTPLCNDPRGGVWLPGNNGLLVVTGSGTVHRTLAPRFECEPMPGLGTGVVAIVYVRDFSQLAVARRDGSVSLHAADTYAEQVRFAAAHTVASGIYWVAKAGRLAIHTPDDRLQVWDLQAQTVTWDVALLKGRELTTPTPDGVLWQIQSDGWLVGIDVLHKEVIRRKLDHDGMHRLAFSADGRQLLTTSPNGSKRIVETQTWKTVNRLENMGSGSVHGGAFWPNEPRMAFAGSNVVDPVTGRVLLSLKADFQFAAFSSISEDGSILVAAASGSEKAYVWWAPSWEAIRQAEAATPR